MGINDTWKIKYEGKQTETFRFLMRLLTYPQWFNFSASHDECESRFEGLNWYSAEYELTEILSNLEPRDKITANVWHDLGKTTIVLTKGEDGSIEIKHNDKTGMKDSFKSKGFKILNSFDKPKDSYTYNMYDFLDRAAGLVDENEDFLELASKYLNKFVKFTPPIMTMEDMKKYLKGKNYNSKLLNEEEKFYDYRYIHSMVQTILDMPLTILDRLGGVLEFNEEFLKRRYDQDFTEAVKQICNGKAGSIGAYGELTTRIRNAQDNYADLPAWIKSLPLKVLYEMGGPHKLYRYVEKYGKEKLFDKLQNDDILWYGYQNFVRFAELQAKKLDPLLTTIPVKKNVAGTPKTGVDEENTTFLKDSNKMSGFEKYSNYLKNIYNIAIKTSPNPLEVLEINGDKYEHLLYEGLHIYHSSSGDITVSQESIYNGNEMDFNNKVLLSLDLNTVGGFEVCYLEGYDKNLNKPIMIKYTKRKIEEEPSVDLNDFSCFAIRVIEEGKGWEWLDNRKGGLELDIEKELEKGYKRLSSEKGSQDLKRIYSKAFNLISKVKQLALKSLNIPNSTNPLDNGTITPEEALQSSLDGLTFEEK